MRRIGIQTNRTIQFAIFSFQLDSAINDELLTNEQVNE